MSLLSAWSISLDSTFKYNISRSMCMWAKQWCGTRMAAGWSRTCLWTLPHWQNSHALAIRVMGLASCGQQNPYLCISIETNAAGIGIPAPGISVRYQSIHAPGIDISIHSGTGLTRCRTVRHLKELYEGGKGYTPFTSTYTNAPSVISQRAEWTI